MSILIKTLAPPTDKPLTRKILIYGDTSAGKTQFAGSAQDVPEMANVIFGSIDGGVSTLTSRGDILSAVTKNAASVEELMWLLVRKDPSVKDVRTLVLDGASEMQKADLADLAQAAHKAKPEKRPDRDVNELLDYKANKAKMLRIFRMARDIPDINLVVTCWAIKEYPLGPGGMPAQGVPPSKIDPDMSKSVRATALGYFDDCWYLEKAKTSEQRMLYTGEVKGITAKTRDRAVAAEMTTTTSEGKVMPYIINPTFADIYARYKKAYKLA